MVDKITLASLTDINGVVSSAVTALNSNFAIIQAFFDACLTTNGTAPNAMNANLDMNNYRILNLPAPVNPTDPVRLSDVSTVSGGGGGGSGTAGQMITSATAPLTPTVGQYYFNTTLVVAQVWNGASWINFG